MSNARLIVRGAAESQVGFAHGNNEDNLFFNGDYITPTIINDDFAIKTGEPADVNVFAIFDGMGRNNSGSYASLLATSRLEEVMDRIAFDTSKTTDEIVLEYIQQTNELVRDQVHDTGGIRTATTMALLIIENGNARVYNVGDSRVYLYRDKQLIKLTRDHVSVKGQRSVALTEEGVRNGGLTKYIGMPESAGTLEPYRAKPFKIKAGDKFILCSDGISDYVDEEDMAACMMRRKDPFGHTNELMALAMREESADNLTVIAVDVVEPGLHITQNMILTALGCLIMVVGIAIGYFFGYVVGGAGKVPIAEQDDLYQLTASTYYTPPADTSSEPPADVSQSDATTASGEETTASEQSTTAPTTTTEPTTTTTKIEYVIDTIDLDKREFMIHVGESYTLVPEIYPVDTPASAVEWKSSDESKATVDENGKVVGVKAGTVTITATIGTESATCTVYVRRAS